jgi:hypothetical protein
MVHDRHKYWTVAGWWVRGSPHVDRRPVRGETARKEATQQRTVVGGFQLHRITPVDDLFADLANKKIGPRITCNLPPLLISSKKRFQLTS